MTPGRLLTMAAFALSCFGLLLFLWVSFGGPTPLKARGYRVDALFPEATQLASQADVRISGVPVGRVVRLRRDGDRTRATIQLKPQYAPLPSDARAVLRQKTLLGETYVELTPGTPTAPKIPEGGTLARSQVRPTVELDEVLRAFDAPSRRNLQHWIQSWSKGVAGRGENISDIIGNVAPLATDGGDVLTTFAAERDAITRLLHDGGTVLGTVGARDAATRELVTAGDELLRTTAARRGDLRATVRALRPFLGSLRGAAASTSAISTDLLPSLIALRPVARDLRPTLARGSVLGDDLRGLSGDLDPVTRAAKGGLPAASHLLRTAGPLLDRLAPLSRQLVPVTAFLDAYRQDFTQSWSKVAAATEPTAPTASGREAHYLRLTAPVWSEAAAISPSRAAANRANPYPAPNALAKLGEGGLESFDCAHAAGSGGLPPLGSPPPCLQQQPFVAGAPASRFPDLGANADR